MTGPDLKTSIKTSYSCRTLTAHSKLKIRQRHRLILTLLMLTFNITRATTFKKSIPRCNSEIRKIQFQEMFLVWEQIQENICLAIPSSFGVRSKTKPRLITQPHIHTSILFTPTTDRPTTTTGRIRWPCFFPGRTSQVPRARQNGFDPSSDSVGSPGPGRSRVPSHPSPSHPIAGPDQGIDSLVILFFRHRRRTRKRSPYARAILGWVDGWTLALKPEKGQGESTPMGRGC